MRLNLEPTPEWQTTPLQCAGGFAAIAGAEHNYDVALITSLVVQCFSVLCHWTFRFRHGRWCNWCLGLRKLARLPGPAKHVLPAGVNPLITGSG